MNFFLNLISIYASTPIKFGDAQGERSVFPNKIQDTNLQLQNTNFKFNLSYKIHIEERSAIENITKPKEAQSLKKFSRGFYEIFKNSKSKNTKLDSFITDNPPSDLYSFITPYINFILNSLLKNQIESNVEPFLKYYFKMVDQCIREVNKYDNLRDGKKIVKVIDEDLMIAVDKLMNIITKKDDSSNSNNISNNIKKDNSNKRKAVSSDKEESSSNNKEESPSNNNIKKQQTAISSDCIGIAKIYESFEFYNGNSNLIPFYLKQEFDQNMKKQIFQIERSLKKKGNDQEKISLILNIEGKYYILERIKGTRYNKGIINCNYTNDKGNINGILKAYDINHLNEEFSYIYLLREYMEIEIDHSGLLIKKHIDLESFNNNTQPLLLGEATNQQSGEPNYFYPWDEKIIKKLLFDVFLAFSHLNEKSLFCINLNYRNFKGKLEEGCINFKLDDILCYSISDPILGIYEEFNTFKNIVMKLSMNDEILKRVEKFFSGVFLIFENNKNPDEIFKKILSMEYLKIKENQSMEYSTTKDNESLKIKEDQSMEYSTTKEDQSMEYSTTEDYDSMEFE